MVGQGRQCLSHQRARGNIALVAEAQKYEPSPAREGEGMVGFDSPGGSE